MQFILSLAKLTQNTVTDYIACEYTRKYNHTVYIDTAQTMEVHYVELCPSFMMCVEEEISASADDEFDYTRRVCPQHFSERFVSTYSPQDSPSRPTACAGNGAYTQLGPQTGLHYVKYDDSGCYKYDKYGWEYSTYRYKTEISTDTWVGVNVAYCDWSKAPTGMKFVPGTPVTIDRKNKVSRTVSIPLSHIFR